MSHRLGHAAKGRGPEAGFTLIELVVSFTIFASVAGVATPAIITSLRSSHTSQQRVDAAAVAQNYVSGFDTVTAKAGTSTVTDPTAIQNESFTVKRTIEFLNANGVADATVTACATGRSVHVHVEVDQKETGDFLAQTDAVLACG